MREQVSCLSERSPARQPLLETFAKIPLLKNYIAISQREDKMYFITFEGNAATKVRDFNSLGRD